MNKKTKKEKRKLKNISGALNSGGFKLFLKLHEHLIKYLLENGTSELSYAAYLALNPRYVGACILQELNAAE